MAQMRAYACEGGMRQARQSLQGLGSEQELSQLHKAPCPWAQLGQEQAPSPPPVLFTLGTAVDGRWSAPLMGQLFWGNSPNCRGAAMNLSDAFSSWHPRVILCHIQDALCRFRRFLGNLAHGEALRPGWSCWALSWTKELGPAKQGEMKPHIQQVPSASAETRKLKINASSPPPGGTFRGHEQTSAEWSQYS